MARKSKKKQQKPNIEEEEWHKSEKVNLENLDDDSQDEFEDQRQKIFFNDEDNGEINDNNFSSEDEVLGIDSDEEDFEEEKYEDINDNEDFYDQEEEEQEKLLRKLSKHLKVKKKLNSDDEEESSEDDEESDLGWGKRRNNYYNADDDSDDEEMAKEEEMEALRLQKKKFSSMREEDFVDDSFDNQLKGAVVSKKKPFSTNLSFGEMEVDEVEEKVPVDLSKQELLDILSNKAPEILSLLDEFEVRTKEVENLDELFDKPQLYFKKSKSTKAFDYLKLKHKILIMYLTNVSFYLLLRASSDDKINVRSHPSLSMIVTIRDILERLEKEVEGKEGDPQKKNHLPEKNDKCTGMPLLMESVEGVYDILAGNVKVSENSDIEISENELEMEEEHEVEELDESEVSDEKFEDNESFSDLDVSINEEKDLKILPYESSLSVDKDILDKFQVKKKSTKNSKYTNSDNYFGEDLELDQLDYEEKKKGKKSLQFHVRKLNQATDKKKNLLLSTGGDEDLPRTDKYGRILKETKEKDEMKLPSESLIFDDEEDAKFLKKRKLDDSRKDDDTPKHVFHPDEVEALTYYNDLLSVKKKKKEEREDYIQNLKRKSLEEHLVEEENIEAEDEEDGDKKRPANWQMLKNKGLTPSRKKIDRNPRVKRRVKFEKAMKKLGTVKKVYTDRSKAKAYQGEMTGIKTHLARSTKL
ncbi:hypothetical protein HDU92_008407 [Lobulomyces angularis]|nr:hypothetical protein HDU92_008407 [Lobulomyces angularis]